MYRAKEGEEDKGRTGMRISESGLDYKLQSAASGSPFGCLEVIGLID